MKQEKLDWLADYPFCTKRFAFYVGRRCRDSSIRDVAEELRLDWKTVKALEMQYMREPLRRLGTPGPKVIGLDEVSIRKGHDYRIVVSDLERKRPIWFGGKDRWEASLDLFFAWLEPKKSKESDWRSSTCGSPFGTRPGEMRRKRPFFLTNFVTL